VDVTGDGGIKKLVIKRGTGLPSHHANLAGGLWYDVRLRSGPIAPNGVTISAHYDGKLESNGQ
jgi:hypothetical protein